LLTQHEKTLLDLKDFEKELQSFDFIYGTYVGKLRYLSQKLYEKCEGKSLSKQEMALEDFIISGFDRSKVTSMIYSIYQNHGRVLGFPEGLPNGVSLKSCAECIKEGLKTYFVPKEVKSETMI